MANVLKSLARMTTSTTGTGTITLGSAVSGFLSFAAAGVSDGDVVSYAIEEGSSREVGYGTYTASGTTLSRTVVHSTNSDAAISLGGAAEVFISPVPNDFGSDVTATVLTSGTAQTYTVPDGVKGLIVKLVGAGAGAGGIGTANATKSAGGGGGGATATIYIPKSALEASYTYSVGAAGSGGSTSGTDGSDGGDTTWDGAASFNVTAGGGEGGAGINGSTQAVGGDGGTASSANLPSGVVVNTVAGGNGGNGYGAFYIFDGNGGGTTYGFGAIVTLAGADGAVPGTGGASGYSSNTASRTGGSGAAGRIEIQEIY